MLTEERKQRIIQYIDTNGGASVPDLMTLLGASESTIRRDLTDLDRKGLITKVHGGALSTSKKITADLDISERETMNHDKKLLLAKYAASLITDEDMVYLDAGTTTGLILEFLTSQKTIFVTNAISHARELSARGYQVYLPGGLLKSRTEALTGVDTCEYLSRFHFTKGFFGSNGITLKQGLTTPDVSEAKVKSAAMQQSMEKYLLCDSSKFDTVSSVTFADFDSSIILTDIDLPSSYKKYKNIKIIY